MEPDADTLGRLIERAMANDQTALRQLYTRFGNAMFNICIRMTGNRQDAEDILQESFIKAFKNLNQLKNERSFPGWLRSIVINNCLQHSKRKSNFVSLADFTEMAEEDDGSWVNEILYNIPI